MGSALTRPITAEDIVYVAMRMARADREEVIAATGQTNMVEALCDSVERSSDCWAFDPTDGPAVCLFGVAPLSMLGTVASPWLLGTDDVQKYPRAMLKGGRACVAYMLGKYTHLVNYVDARHVRSLQWLKRIGFTIHAPGPFGPRGLPFHKAEICAPQ